MARTGPESPPTSAGSRPLVRVPFPSWPLGFHPQHFTDPSCIRAQVCPAPASTAVTPASRPGTSTGVPRLTVVPSPSPPEAFSPQHFTPPVSISAQLCRCPVAAAFTPCESPNTRTGERLSVAVPSPSWPLVFDPQHSNPPLESSAQACDHPAAIDFTPPVMRLTACGRLLERIVPLPNCP